MYYAACYGDGCILDQNEFEALMQNYQKTHNIPDEEQEDLMDCVSCESANLIRSQYADTDTDGTKLPFDHTFEISSITDDSASGVFFTPFIRSNSDELNITKVENGKIVESQECQGIDTETVYFIYSDKSRVSAKTFIENPYPSFEDFVNEFKNKIEKYLPEDFDLKHHLGHISYALFA